MSQVLFDLCSQPKTVFKLSLLEHI